MEEGGHSRCVLKSDCFINTDGVEDGGNTSLLRREEGKLTGRHGILNSKERGHFKKKKSISRGPHAAKRSRRLPITS